MSDKKQKILDVAEKLIAAHGYRSTTTRMIAEHAGVNVAMLAYYFGSKELLLRELLDRHTAAVKELLDVISSEKAPAAETFRKFLFSYVDYSFQNPRPVIIAIREIGLLNQRPEIMRNLQKTMLEVHGMFIEVLGTAMKTGELRNIDIELSVLTFSSTIESYVVNAFMFDEAFPFLGIEQRSPDIMKERLKSHLSMLLENLMKESES
ncbi:TetR/AcrR family transcriptional regulator [Natronogracilivirga saccharolytica]|uniref:TetR/AcrR family transcriptional regulator n=1 Tax=Natronogracilivirga saccharolytica TaxID=2812953 RepID=A0A8J7UUG0_9BACT|nr:TetR/AcrR family transcriptional regulator [Natronogracilivirga saccharolytica]MBP3193596.1 TetR/AcrR family transcriptional regulator [Natronogracilivirga saccharolytica]